MTNNSQKHVINTRKELEDFLAKLPNDGKTVEATVNIHSMIDLDLDDIALKAGVQYDHLNSNLYSFYKMTSPDHKNKRRTKFAVIGVRTVVLVGFLYFIATPISSDLTSVDITTKLAIFGIIIGVVMSPIVLNKKEILKNSIRRYFVD